MKIHEREPLPLAAQTVPEWWIDLFADRQRRIRGLVIHRLQISGAPLALGQLTQFLTRYQTTEIHYALDRLVRDGLLEIREAVIRVEGRWGVTERQDRYYTLAAVPEAQPQPDGEGGLPWQVP